MSEAAAGPGHNSALTDDQLRALAYHHMKEFKAALAEKKRTAADFLAVTKRIKSEGTDLDDIKDLIRLETPEGEVAIKSEIERKVRSARWAGADFGTQFSFLDEEDRTPLEDRSREEGKIAGMKGEAANAPSHLPINAAQAWMEGWHDGQKALMSALELTKAGMESASDAAKKKAEAKAAKANGNGAEKKKAGGRKKKDAAPPEPKKSFAEQLRDKNAEVEEDLKAQRTTH